MKNLSHGRALILLAALLVVLAGCGMPDQGVSDTSPAGTTVIPTPNHGINKPHAVTIYTVVPVTRTPFTPVIQNNTVLVPMLQMPALLEIHVGQKLQITPPERLPSGTTWKTDYDPSFLGLDAQIEASRPPATGWIWTMREAGTTEIGFEQQDSCPDVCPETHVRMMTIRIVKP